MRAETLEVFLHQAPCGVLTAGRRPGLATFRYHSNAIVPLSVSMPLREEPFDPVATRNWFAGLLPEGERLEALTSFLGIPEGDWLSVLAALGADCAGAVSFGDGEGEPSALLEPIVAALPALPASAAAGDLVGLIAGHQPKAVGSKSSWTPWMTPGPFSPSTHVLKPEPRKWPGMADAEAWATTVAGLAARAAKVSVEVIGGARTLVSKRFDRADLGGIGASAVHQEDLLQALGLPLANKYAKPGGSDRSDPTLRKAAALLADKAADPHAELDELLRHLTVNVLLGNTDWHAKNISFLLAVTGEVSLAPMYDVVPAQAFLPGDAHLSLPVNGKFRLDRVGFDDLVEEAVSWGVDRHAAELVVLMAMDTVRHAVDEADRLHPGRPEAAAELVHRQRAALCGVHV